MKSRSCKAVDLFHPKRCAFLPIRTLLFICTSTTEFLGKVPPMWVCAASCGYILKFFFSQT